MTFSFLHCGIQSLLGWWPGGGICGGTPLPMYQPLWNVSSPTVPPPWIVSHPCVVHARWRQQSTKPKQVTRSQRILQNLSSGIKEQSKLFSVWQVVKLSNTTKLAQQPQMTEYGDRQASDASRRTAKPNWIYPRPPQTDTSVHHLWKPRNENRDWWSQWEWLTLCLCRGKISLKSVMLHVVTCSLKKLVCHDVTAWRQRQLLSSALAHKQGNNLEGKRVAHFGKVMDHSCEIADARYACSQKSEALEAMTIVWRLWPVCRRCYNSMMESVKMDPRRHWRHRERLCGCSWARRHFGRRWRSADRKVIWWTIAWCYGREVWALHCGEDQGKVTMTVQQFNHAALRRSVMECFQNISWQNRTQKICLLLHKTQHQISWDLNWPHIYTTAQLQWGENNVHILWWHCSW